MKEIDEEIKKEIKTIGKEDGKALIEMLFDRISDYSKHPMLDIIETSVQSLNMSISRILLRKDTKGCEIVVHIRELVSQTASELKVQLFEYFNIKSDTVDKPLESLLFDLSFSSIQDLFVKKEMSHDFQFEIQRKRFICSNLREVIGLEGGFYPPKDIDGIFPRSIKTVSLLKEVTTLDQMRELVTHLYRTVNEEISDYNNGTLPSELTPNDILNVEMYCIMKSIIDKPNAVASFLNAFTDESDEKNVYGCSIKTFDSAINGILTKL